MVVLKTEKREVFGKKLKEARSKGKLPGIVYGQGIREPIPVFIVKDEFKKIFKQARETDFIDLMFDEGKKSVLIKDIKTDSASDEPIHIDFFAPRLDKPIVVKGLPKEIPHQIEVDLSLLKNIEDRITVSDIKFPTGIKSLAKEKEVIILATLPKKEEEVVPEAAPLLEDIEVVKKGKKEEEGEEVEEASGAKKPEEKKKEEKKK